MVNKETTYGYVNHPNHYNQYDVEVLTMMERIWGKDAVINFCKLSAFKYRMRMGTKPNEPIDRDIAKEKFYLDYAQRLHQESLSILDEEPNEDNKPSGQSLDKEDSLEWIALDKVVK